jgi:membrane-associated phospholipid phosphatase
MAAGEVARVAANQATHRHEIARRRLVPARARRLLAGSLAGFLALLVGVRTQRLAGIDAAITLRVQASRSPALERLMHAVSWPGFPPQSRIIPPALIAASLARGRRLDAGFQLASWGTAFLSTIVKAFVRRPRPLPRQVRVVVAPLGGTSFPSGHVLTYVGFYGFLGYLLALRLEQPVVRDLGAGAAVALIALIGPSRIQQGHHWPTDVAASYLLGAAYLLILVELHSRLADPR